MDNWQLGRCTISDLLIGLSLRGVLVLGNTQHTPVKLSWKQHLAVSVFGTILVMWIVFIPNLLFLVVWCITLVLLCIHGLTHASLAAGRFLPAFLGDTWLAGRSQKKDKTSRRGSDSERAANMSQVEYSLREATVPFGGWSPAWTLMIESYIILFLVLLCWLRFPVSDGHVSQADCISLVVSDYKALSLTTVQPHDLALLTSISHKPRCILILYQD